MKKLSQAGIDALSSKQVKTYSRVLINGVEVKPQSYQYGFNKSFGAASTRIVLPNQDGKYSPYGSNPIKWNDPTIIEEGLYNKNGVLEKWTKLTALVRQMVPKIERGIQTLEITALDRIVRLEDLDLYEHFYEANKTTIGGYVGVKLKPYPDGEGYAQIFDFVDADYDNGGVHVTDIAPNPIPRIRVRNLTTYLSDPKWEGFQINYQTGQLILDVPIQTKDYEIFAIFSYYKTIDGLYVEDLIESIITAQDGYGNYPISENDIKTDLLTEDGVSEDIMTPDYSEVVGGKTKNWFLSYNNLITSLIAGDFEIPGGASFSSFDKRLGKLVLDTAILLNSVVKCKTNYNFWTIQATGIQTPYLSFPAREIPNRFEALNQLRRLLAPNYIFQTRGSSKIWGRYLNQKVTVDYELKLKERLEYAGDMDTYTRIKLFGENANPTNLMRNLTSDDYEWGYEYKAQVSEKQLLLARQDPEREDSYIFDVVDKSQLKMAKILNNPEPPSLYVDGVRLNMGRTLVSVQDPGEESNFWGFIKEHPEEYEHEIIVGIWFTGRLDTQKNIIIRSAYYPNYTIYPDDQYMEWKDGKYRYEWRPSLGHTRLSAVIASDFYVRSSNDFGITDNHESFWVNKRVIPTSEIRNDILVNRPVIFTNVKRLWDYDSKNRINDGDYWRFGDWWGHGSPNTATEIMIPLNDWFIIDRISWVGTGKGTTPTVPYVYSEILGSKLEIQLNTPDGWRTVYRVEHDPAEGYQRLLGKVIWVPPSGISYYYKPGYWVGGTDHIYIEPEYANAIKLKIYGGWFPQWSIYRIDVRGGELECRGVVLKNVIKTDFWYSANATIPDDIKYLHDGLYATQVQSVYPYKPLKGAVWATFDFGAEKNIQAIDLIAGFYLPDSNIPTRRYDTNMNLTLEYAPDAVDLAHATFHEISKEATGFGLNSGDKVSFEPDELGENFKMRWLRIKIEDLNQIEALGKKVWVLSLVELAIYSDVVISSECQLTDDQSKVDSNDYDTDTTIYYYDSKDLLTSIGDRIYKKKEIDKILNTQRKLNLRAYNLLKEFYKEHSKVSTRTPIGSYIELGQTLKISDIYSKVFSGSSQNYFVDSINVSGKRTTLILARYE